MPDVGTPLDPLDAQFFQLEFTGIPPKIFEQVTMPATTVQVEKSYETATNGQPLVRRSIGRPEYSELSVSGGVTTDRSLETWLQGVIDKGVGAAGGENEKEGL